MSEDMYKADLTAAAKENVYYVLAMFPYPSGAGLHVGHGMNFTAGDIMARFKRMNGYTVINPMGWDSFGLPTENYAMKMGKPASEVTDENIEHYKAQCKLMDWSYDWDREIATSKPEYYKWTQWIFQQLFKAGLVYKKDAFVNRCPSCQTVLANDQVIDGKCERCETEIIQKKHPQWFIQITAYAEKLIADLDLVDRPEETKTQQKYWIGKSEGAEIEFGIKNSNDRMTGGQDDKITVFTTRPDTLFGVTALVLAPENASIDAYIPEGNRKAVDEYRLVTSKKTSVERQQDAEEKSGVFSGVYAIHPLTNQEVPIRFADYVLPDYATGAVMFVPAHDERDWAFAKKHGLEIKQVVLSKEIEKALFKKCLRIHTEVQSIADSLGVIPYLAGGMSIAALQGVMYRAHNDLDYYMKEKEVNLLLEALKKAGYSYVSQKWENTHVLEKDGFEVEIGSNDMFPPSFVTKEDCNETPLSLQGLKCYSLSLSFSKRLKELQFSQTNKEKFQLDLSKIENGSYTKEGVLINSGEFDGLDNVEAKKVITEHLEKQGLGRKKITYKLRDWSVSRQRYWGSPIPVYYTFNENETVPYFKNTTDLPWKAGVDVQTRTNVAVVIKHWSEDKYLLIKWKNQFGVSFVTGGVDRGETLAEAAIREGQEETGYKSFIYTETVPGEVHTSFYAPHKDVNRYMIQNAVVVTLQNEERGDNKWEAHEDFDYIWATKEEVNTLLTWSNQQYQWKKYCGLALPETATIDRYNAYNPHPDKTKRVPHLIPEENLPVVLPLDLGDYKPMGKSPLEDHATFRFYTKPAQTEQVPYFEYHDEVRGIREDAPWKERHIVQAIIKDPKNDKILALQWKLDGAVSFIAGGVEEGEETMQALLREIREETGYKNIKLVRDLGPFELKLYHALKGFNQHSTGQTYLFEIVDHEHDELAAEELEKHEPVWLTAKEFLSASTDVINAYYIDILAGKKPEPMSWITRDTPEKTYLRECDTLDTFMCSSFYFLRFIDPKNTKEIISRELADKAMPVDFYIGGKEHTYGHLLYSRFIHKFLFDQGYVGCPEPFQKLFHQGMVLGPDGRKMSKRRGNIVKPEDVAKEYGVDTFRTYVMFMGPLEAEKAWNYNAVQGVKKFLDRAERMQEFLAKESNTDVEIQLHKTIKGITDDIEKLKFNTAVSKMMIFVNYVYDKKTITVAQLAIFLQLLAPFATGLAQSMWEKIGQKGNVHISTWPTYDESLIHEDTLALPVQINGKMRGTLDVKKGITEEEVMVELKADDKLQKYLAEGEIKKVIYVQDKIVNIIIQS